MKLIINLLVSSAAVFVSAYILPGVHVDSFGTAIIVAVILGILNAFIRPALVLLTLPITIVTLGLFTLVINAFLIILVTKLIPEFQVESFLWAVVFSIVLSAVNWFFSSLTNE